MFPLKKYEIVQKISEELQNKNILQNYDKDVYQFLVSEILDLFVELSSDAISEGRSVNIKNFATLYIKNGFEDEITIYNPHSKEYRIGKRNKSIGVKISKALKEKINRSTRILNNVTSNDNSINTERIRIDSSGRELRAGEYQNKDGRYRFVRRMPDGRRKTYYSWKLEDADCMPDGKENCESLRSIEGRIINEIK